MNKRLPLLLLCNALILSACTQTPEPLQTKGEQGYAPEYLNEPPACEVSPKFNQKLSKEFARVECWRTGLIRVKKTEEPFSADFGLYSSDGTELLAPNHTFTPINAGEYTIVSKHTPDNYQADFFYGLINDKGEFVIPMDYTELLRMGSSLFKVEKNHLKQDTNCNVVDCIVSEAKGLIDLNNTPLLETKYYIISSLERNGSGKHLFTVWNKHHNVALYDAHQEKFLSDFIYADIGEFDDYGRARVEQLNQENERLEGLIDTKGEILLPIEYRSIVLRDDSSYLLVEKVAEKNSRWGVANGAGNIIVPIEYDAVDFMLDEADGGRVTAYVEKSGKRYSLEKDGSLSEFFPNIEFIHCDDKAINKAFFNQFKYQHIECVWGGLVVTTLSSQGLRQQGLYQLDGTEIMPDEYKFRWLNSQKSIASYRPEGYSTIGLINNETKTASKPIYYEIRAFSDGLAAVVTEEDLWGFIDPTGKAVIPPQFNAIVSPFHKGKASVVNKQKETITIDKTGKPQT